MDKGNLLAVPFNNQWKEIYESRQTGKILRAEVTAIEKHEDTLCAVIFYGDAKVLISMEEMGMQHWDSVEDKIKEKIMFSIVGSSVEYIVIGIDRDNDLATGSRKKAMEIRQRDLKNIVPGRVLPGSIITVGRKGLIVEVSGVEVKLTAPDISWGFIDDLRDFWNVGRQVNVLVKDVNFEDKKIKVSIKELIPDPIKKVGKKYILKESYVGRVTGVVEWGVFVNLEPGLDLHCPHPGWTNLTLTKGDKVIIKLVKVDFEKRKVSGVIQKMI